MLLISMQIRANFHEITRFYIHDTAEISKMLNKIHSNYCVTFQIIVQYQQ